RREKMPKNVIQKVVFRATPQQLYDMYLSAKEHAAFTGRPARVQKKVGSRFSAFGGMLSGRILYLIPGRQIVQAWRSAKFHKGDPDSTLILNFVKTRSGAEVRLAHIHVPDHDYADINKGWPRYYWKPWAAYLKRQRKRT